MYFFKNYIVSYYCTINVYTNMKILNIEFNLTIVNPTKVN